ncbi:MAG: type III secretion chaperone SycN [Deltaproteobacteria bacterium]|jgi:type III secretion system chaperone SycN|nr:type III secretion chaperone SycN [Deltaproteobacteria bacterium]
MANEHIIAEFGRRMGLRDLRLTPDGTLRLDIEGMGALFLEQGEGEMLVYLARNFPSHDRGALRRALALCRPGPARPFTLYAGLRRPSTLILLTRFAENDFSLQMLEQAVPALSRLMDEALRAAG